VLVTAAWFGTKNVGEIDETWYQFHQRFTLNFYERRSQKRKYDSFFIHVSFFDAARLAHVAGFETHRICF